MDLLPHLENNTHNNKSNQVQNLEFLKVTYNQSICTISTASQSFKLNSFIKVDRKTGSISADHDSQNS